MFGGHDFFLRETLRLKQKEFEQCVDIARLQELKTECLRLSERLLSSDEPSSNTLFSGNNPNFGSLFTPEAIRQYGGTYPNPEIKEPSMKKLKPEGKPSEEEDEKTADIAPYERPKIEVPLTDEEKKQKTLLINQIHDQMSIINSLILDADQACFPKDHDCSMTLNTFFEQLGIVQQAKQELMGKALVNSTPLFTLFLERLARAENQIGRLTESMDSGKPAQPVHPVHPVHPVQPVQLDTMTVFSQYKQKAESLLAEFCTIEKNPERQKLKRSYIENLSNEMIRQIKAAKADYGPNNPDVEKEKNRDTLSAFKAAIDQFKNEIDSKKQIADEIDGKKPIAFDPRLFFSRDASSPSQQNSHGGLKRSRNP